MKKAVIGLGVAVMFVVYSLVMRQNTPKILAPQPVSTATGPASTNTPTTTVASGGSGTPTTGAAGQYKDGTYTGSVADAFYGNVQVQAKVSGGKITDVSFLQYPNTHDTSVMINRQAMPYLRQEAIQAQTANVQIISGATFTSQAFAQSLRSALSQAKA
jgi:uncharacterized protein with FMN-binding domain